MDWLCCCGGHRRCSSSSSSYAHEPLPSEHTPLLHDTLPQLPQASSLPDDEQRLADELAARQVVDEASERIINVQSSTPFAHLRLPSPPPSEGSSTWRAPDDPPLPPEIRRLRLGFDDHLFQPQHLGPARRDQCNGDLALRRSSHSLKALPKARGKAERNPRRGSSRGDGSCTEDEGAGTDFHTALEGWRGDASANGGGHLPPPNGKRRALADVEWGGAADMAGMPDEGAGTRDGAGEGEDEGMHDGFGELPPEDPDCLTDDPVKLKKLIQDGFKLGDTGSLVASL